MINLLADQIHQNNVDKGFYEDEKNIGEMLALIHSEVSEALEADREGKYCETNMGVINSWEHDEVFKPKFEDRVKNTFEDELADIVIRVLDLAAHKGINLERHIEAKMRYNKLRPHKHGKKY